MQKGIKHIKRQCQYKEVLSPPDTNDNFGLSFAVVVCIRNSRSLNEERALLSQSSVVAPHRFARLSATGGKRKLFADGLSAAKQSER